MVELEVGEFGNRTSNQSINVFNVLGGNIRCADQVSSASSRAIANLVLRCQDLLTNIGTAHHS